MLILSSTADLRGGGYIRMSSFFLSIREEMIFNLRMPSQVPAGTRTRVHMVQREIGTGIYLRLTIDTADQALPTIFH